MTPAQLRQARALSQISQGQAAKLADMPSHVLIDYERHGKPPSPQQGGPARLAALREALEAVGVEFEGGDAAGVKLRRSEP